MSNAIACVVLIDGKVISDGCSSLDPNEPAVLSGLRIDWGRDTVVDQPSASTCTFEIDNPLAGSRLLPTLTIGRKIDVRTDTLVYPDPDVSVIPNLFATEVVNATTSGSGTATSTVTGYAGTSLVAEVVYPPLALSSSPIAWDGVPRAQPGQAWRLKATVGFPTVFCGWRAQSARIRPVTYTSPAGPSTMLPDSDSRLVSPTAPTADFSFIPPGNVWLGVKLRINPTGPTWEQLDSSTWTSIAGDARTWDSMVRFTLSNVQMLAPAAGAVSSALAFSGRITDVVSKWDGSPYNTLHVIAQDWISELGNRFVGDTPWAVEGLQSRAQKIITASGQPVTLTVDSGIASLPVSYRDVDRQPAAQLLQQLATSAGGVLWTATHLSTGQVLRIEDVNGRPAAKTLEVSAVDGYVHVIANPAASVAALPLTACDFDVEPVEVSMDTTDTISIVAVQWLEQGTDPGPPVKTTTTQRTVETSDPDMSALIGARRLSVSTILTTEANAAAQANSWLARTGILAWKISGLRWDTAEADLSPSDITAVMKLLNGTTRIGLLISVTDLPQWMWPVTGGSAVALYIEGGTYTYEAGSWILELTTSSAFGSTGGRFPWTNPPPEWVWANTPVPGAPFTGQNLFTKPSFQDGLVSAADWAATNCTLAPFTWATPADPNAGVKGMRATVTAAGAASVATANPLKVPVQVGHQYRVTAFTRSQTAALLTQISAEFRDASNVLVAGSSISGAATGQTTFVRKNVLTIAAPSNAVTLHIVMSSPSGAAAGQFMDWDAIMVTDVTADPNAALVPYFDGDTPDTAATNYYWSGAQWASISGAEATGAARNLLLRSSFEDGAITGWGTSGPAPVTPPAWSNSTELAAAAPGHTQGGLVRTQFSTAGGVLQNATANRPPISVGRIYAISAYARGAITVPTAGTVKLRGAYLDSGNAIIAGTQVDGPTQPLTATWRRTTPLVMPPAPAGAVTFYMAVVWAPGPVAANQYVDLSMFMIEELAAADSVPTSFFDGDTADTASVAYDWTGTARNSPSSRSAPATSFAPDVSWLDLYGVVWP